MASFLALLNNPEELLARRGFVAVAVIGGAFVDFGGAFETFFVGHHGMSALAEEGDLATHFSCQ